MMDCDCSCTDYLRNDVYRSDMRTARKPHKCCECQDTIGPGQRYEDVAALTEGGWWTAKTCEPCKYMRNHYCPDGFCHGGLAETLMECLGFSPYQVEADDE